MATRQGREGSVVGGTTSQTAGLAGRVIADIEQLEVSQGEGVGGPLRLLNWERRFIRGALKPGVSESALTVARGNGKTTLCAGLAVSALQGALRVPRGEVTVVASSFDQARVTFEHVLAFVGRDAKRWRIQDSANRAIIECRQTGARVRCLGSDPRRAHGLAPALVLADEPAQWPPSTSERMISALRTGLGKIPDSRLVSLGTRPAAPSHWFATALAGGADYSQSHAARPKDPPFRARTWRRANPSFDAMPALAAKIKEDAAKARRDPVQLASFRALRLNEGVSETVEGLLITAETWQRIEGNAPPNGHSAWGVDLGSGAAMSAIATYHPATGHLAVLAAFPELPDLAERERADAVPMLYRRMESRGELILAGRRVVDISALLSAALERFGPPDCLVCDRWRDAELRQSLEDLRFPLVPLITRGQGFKDGAEDVRDFRAACLSDEVTPGESLLLRAAMAEARTVADPAGNEKLAKASQGGRRMRAKDDAAAAAILAVAEGRRRAKSQPSADTYAVV